MSPAQAVSRCLIEPRLANEARAWRAQHEREILQEFSELLAIPNLANDAPNIERNAATIRAMLEKRGLTTQLLTLGDAPPIVVGDLAAPGATRTIAFYAHYDGQPVDPAKWKSDPWKPVMRDRAGTRCRLAERENDRPGMAPLRAFFRRRQGADHRDAGGAGCAAFERIEAGA